MLHNLEMTPLPELQFFQARPAQTLPFSDWLARVHRIAKRHGTSVECPALVNGLYDAGVSPMTAVEIWLEG